jgi:hypothetical protein
VRRNFPRVGRTSDGTGEIQFRLCVCVCGSTASSDMIVKRRMNGTLLSPVTIIYSSNDLHGARRGTSTRESRHTYSNRATSEKTHVIYSPKHPNPEHVIQGRPQHKQRGVKPSPPPPRVVYKHTSRQAITDTARRKAVYLASPCKPIRRA